MEPAKVLDMFRETGALLGGHFELRSGLHSDQYFQCALVLQHPRLAAQLCQALLDQFNAAGPAGRVDAVISPALGGIPVGHELARGLGVRHIFAEKEAGRMALRRFSVQRGERFIVAEDVVTRGGRVREVMDLVTAAGGSVAAALVLVDRSGGRATLSVPMFSLTRMAPPTWEPADCPLCRQGVPLDHPGSR